MTLWQALLLGLVQGLTEFLPISSSGHLVLVNHLLGISDDSIVFEIAVHLGTLVAVLIYFRRDLADIIGGFFRGGRGMRVGWMLIIAMVPTAIIGFGFKDFFESMFDAPKYASAGLLFTSLILFLSERVRQGTRGLTGIRVIDALLIGTLQGLAIMPGVSRSGSTIAAGLFAGLDRDTAARFSFLLAIPAILGAAVLHAKDFVALPIDMMVPSVAGFLVAMFSGYIAIEVLMRIIRRRKLYVFVIYTAVVGIIGLIFLPA
ncbi:undecaprenyl-diphosphatase UppP [bacterium]|nr:undecaprenyl-diphosphatase UppP [bacterium]